MPAQTSAKKAGFFTLHDAAREHHIETPLQLLAGEPALEVVVVRHQVAQEALLVADAGGCSVVNIASDWQARSHERIAEPVV